MEVFGGLMTMLGMAWFFLALIWLVTPFVIFAIKGKVDRSHQLLEQLERRLCDLERRLPPTTGSATDTPTLNPPPATAPVAPSAPVGHS